MALTNFSELKSNIADFLNRTDLTSVIPTFIAMAEAQFNRDIRHYKMENRATATVATQYVERPSDWLESIRMHLTGSGTTVVNFISAQAMASFKIFLSGISDIGLLEPLKGIFIDFPMS